MSKEINIGIIGYKFMGKAHSSAFTQLPIYFGEDMKVNKKIICGRNEDKVKRAASQFGWEEYATDYRELIKRDDINVIDVTTPSNYHKQIVMEAIDAGKNVFCEKPLALNVQDAREMHEAAAKKGIKHQIGFNYRFVPAIRLAKQLIDEGRLGKVYHFRARYLQDWATSPDFPLTWRFDKKVCGSGSSGDLGAHVIDLAHFLVGDLKVVTGINETFIKQRPIIEGEGGLSAKAEKGAPLGEVLIDDATIFCGQFECGALASFEMTRYAAGNKNGMGFEINGDKGSVKFFFERMNELMYCDYTQDGLTQGFTRIQTTDYMHSYAKYYYPAGHVIGYADTFTCEMYEFIKAIKENDQAAPGFEAGVKAAQVIDAVDLSIANRAWVNVAEV
ncbi:MAG: Gfo/Idh/MocA family oxidoreductase [Clostridia bacterium]|nr:Gfo/Idh/MocA family oxidoreductase [Clostridia bacterium]